jgi:hypothetical protein
MPVGKEYVIIVSKFPLDHLKRMSQSDSGIWTGSLQVSESPWPNQMKSSNSFEAGQVRCSAVFQCKYRGWHRGAHPGLPPGSSLPGLHLCVWLGVEGTSASMTQPVDSPGRTSWTHSYLVNSPVWSGASASRSTCGFQ